jgi:hypothetical protein
MVGSFVSQLTEFKCAIKLWEEDDAFYCLVESLLPARKLSLINCLKLPDRLFPSSLRAREVIQGNLSSCARLGNTCFEIFDLRPESSRDDSAALNAIANGLDANEDLDNIRLEKFVFREEECLRRFLAIGATAVSLSDGCILGNSGWSAPPSQNWDQCRLQRFKCQGCSVASGCIQNLLQAISQMPLLEDVASWLAITDSDCAGLDCMYGECHRSCCTHSQPIHKHKEDSNP